MIGADILRRKYRTCLLVTLIVLVMVLATPEFEMRKANAIGSSETLRIYVEAVEYSPEVAKFAFTFSMGAKAPINYGYNW